MSEMITAREMVRRFGNGERFKVVKVAPDLFRVVPHTPSGEPI